MAYDRVFSEMVPNPVSSSILKQYERDGARSYFAEVEAVYSDRNTADIRVLTSGAKLKNVPVKTRGGLIDGEVYGELDLPDVGNIVNIQFLANRESMPFISGAILPYLYSKFQADQTPVDSSSKAFTLKLLEAGKEKHFRKIFKSGTTVEVEEDGTLIIETPSGTYIKIDEASSGDVTIEANSNTFSMESGKVVINSNLEVLQ